MERRINPEDDELWTFQKLVEVNKGWYSYREIQAYWETMKPEGAKAEPDAEALAELEARKETAAAGAAAVAAAVAQFPSQVTQRLGKGSPIEFFHSADPAKKDADLLLPKGGLLHQAGVAGAGPLLLQSHGWLEGTLVEDFDPATFDATEPSTWPHVAAASRYTWADMRGKRRKASSRRVMRIREAEAGWAPTLSAVFVRWGGPCKETKSEPNDGDWGHYGCPTGDEYMSALVEEGIMVHPTVGQPGGCDVEVFSAVVRTSWDVSCLGTVARALASILQGQHKAMFWMLWPAEWEDFDDDPDYAGYIERQSLFGAMRQCEGHGLVTGFPHPADLYELITSKAWMATFSVHPHARLPACTLVAKSDVATDPAMAAKMALMELERLRTVNPFPAADDGGPATLASVNSSHIKKGVVKIGFSWENRFVLTFNGVKELGVRLKEMCSQEGCTSSHCLVQEWVEFDFEMRLYFLPPAEWSPGCELEPTRIECNAWGQRDEQSGLGRSHASFWKMPKDRCVEMWGGDEEAWVMACSQATTASRSLLAYLLTEAPYPLPFLRLDFMVRRVGPGKARVVFGEYCEMGACCLGWREGPPTIWKSAIDATLR